MKLWSPGDQKTKFGILETDCEVPGDKKTKFRILQTDCEIRQNLEF